MKSGNGERMTRSNRQIPSLKKVKKLEKEGEDAVVNRKRQ